MLAIIAVDTGMSSGLGTLINLYSSLDHQLSAIANGLCLRICS